MADAVTNFSALATDAPNVFIAQRTFMLAEKQLVLGRFATRYSLPQRTGKTLRIVRHKRLDLPLVPLTEGTPPDAVALSIENVDVTVEQWGIVVLLTDVGMITTKHPALQAAIDGTGRAMAELLEREMARTLMSGTQTFFAGAAEDTRDDIAAASKLDTATILKTTTALRAKGAPAFEGGLFGGAMPPQCESDIVGSDTTFKDVEAFANVRKFEVNEIGVWGAVRWVRSNYLPIFKGVAAPDTAAVSAEKGKVVLSGTGGPFANTDVVKVRIVARDAKTDIEHKISQEGTATITASDEDVVVTTPTSTAYTYDIYVSEADNSSVVRKQFSRVAANTASTLTGFQATGDTAPVAPASGREVFTVFVQGRDAWGRVELNGMSLQSFLTPPGASFSNPLAQGRKIGNKIAWKSFIIDDNFLARIEVASGFSAFLPA